MPRGLRASGRRLWRSVVDEYDLDAHEQLLLLEACRVADRLASLAVAGQSAPLTVTNRHGDQVASPFLVEARQQQLTFARLLASLRLPSGEVITPAQALKGLERSFELVAKTLEHAPPGSVPKYRSASSTI